MNSELLLDSLQVKGFRAFEDLQIPKLGRVNLITGKNNVGKTCLLEALQVYARRGAPNVLQSLLVRRDETYVSGNMKPQEVSRYLDNMRHVFYGRPDSDEQCRLEVGSLTNSKCRVSVHFEEIDFQEEENVDDLRKILSGSAWTRHSMASKAC